MEKMNVLLGCEFSGVVRDAFREQGHNAFSCDLIDGPEPSMFHIKQDVIEVIKSRHWDLVIAFPPCTHLCVSGARWFAEKRKKGLQQKSVAFFLHMVEALNKHADRWCIENPVGIMSKYYRKPNQYIQPFEHGHGETKKTCLWLHNLPELKPSNVVSGRESRIHFMSPSDDRGKKRSIFYKGIASAMSTQWSFKVSRKKEEYRILGVEDGWSIFGPHELEIYCGESLSIAEWNLKQIKEHVETIQESKTNE